MISYRKDIDGLRAIAVLSVLAFHIAPNQFKGGFVGVDIFFVISGFLISSIIYHELESGRFRMTDFYVRRIRRIYPALFIVLAAVCVMGWFFLLPTEFVLLGKQIVGGSTFSANFVLWQQSGYFDVAAAKKPLLHLWSLGVEEQYYLVFPVVCIMFYRAKQRWSLPIAFLAISLVSMVVNVALVGRYSSAAFLLPFSRLWELFMGAGLALTSHRNLPLFEQSRLPSRWHAFINVSGLALILFSIIGIDQSDSFPGWWALLPTLGAVLIIASGPNAWVSRSVLSSKPLVFIGLISYPLYLWHWPLICFMRLSSSVWGVDTSTPMKGTIIALCFVLAYLTYLLIERPLRQVKQRSKQRTSALCLLTCVSLTGVFGALVILQSGFPHRLPAAVVALDHNYEPELEAAWRGGHCFLRPDQSAVSFANDCLDPADEHTERPLILLWGDSHAADLFPGFRAMQSQSSVRLAQYTASLCAPIIGLQVPDRPECLRVNDAIFARVKVLKPHTVILSADWTAGECRNAVRNGGLLRTIKLAREAGVERVVIVGSAPKWTTPLPGLLVKEVRLHPDSPLPQRLPRTLLQPQDDEFLVAITRQGGAEFVSLVNSLCDPLSCIATTGSDWKGVITYDNSHFTEHGSVVVARGIWQNVLYSPMLSKGIDQIGLDRLGNKAPEPEQISFQPRDLTN